MLRTLEMASHREIETPEADQTSQFFVTSFFVAIRKSTKVNFEKTLNRNFDTLKICFF
jgi:hypothetical protein